MKVSDLENLSDFEEFDKYVHDNGAKFSIKHVCLLRSYFVLYLLNMEGGEENFKEKYEVISNIVKNLDFEINYRGRVSSFIGRHFYLDTDFLRILEKIQKIEGES